MNAQKRRMCIEQHKREADRLIAEKKAMEAADEVVLQPASDSANT